MNSVTSSYQAGGPDGWSGVTLIWVFRSDFSLSVPQLPVAHGRPSLDVIYVHTVDSCSGGYYLTLITHWYCYSYMCWSYCLTGYSVSVWRILWRPVLIIELKFISINCGFLTIYYISPILWSDSKYYLVWCLIDIGPRVCYRRYGSATGFHFPPHCRPDQSFGFCVIGFRGSNQRLGPFRVTQVTWYSWVEHPWPRGKPYQPDLFSSAAISLPCEIRIIRGILKHVREDAGYNTAFHFRRGVLSESLEVISLIWLEWPSG